MRLSGAFILATLLCSAAKAQPLSLCDLFHDLKPYNGRTVQIQAELFLDKDRTAAAATCDDERLERHFSGPTALHLEPAPGLPNNEHLALEQARREAMESRRLSKHVRVTAVLEGAVETGNEYRYGLDREYRTRIVLARISQIQSEVLPDAEDLPVIDVCDLFLDLHAYNGKRVAIRGEIGGRGGTTMYGIACKKQFETDSYVWKPAVEFRRSRFALDIDRKRDTRTLADVDAMIRGRRNVHALYTAVGIVQTRERYRTMCVDGWLRGNGFEDSQLVPAEFFLETRMAPSVVPHLPADEEKQSQQCPPAKRAQPADCSAMDLTTAAASGCLGRVRELGANKLNVGGNVAPMRASMNGFADIVQALLQSGVSPNVRVGDELPICKAIKARSTEAVEVLLAFGAIIDNSIESECSLLEAAERGDAKMIHALATNGANLESSDRFGRTPLMRAAEVGKKANVHALLKAGANVNAKDADDETALIKAAYSNDIVVELLNARADPNAPGKNGYTPLMRAAVASRDDVVRLLLDAGAAVDLRDAAGETALHKAIRSGYIDAIPVLLEAGADPRIRNVDGKTPADLANKYQLEALQRKP
jgi:ankyrin repeat protein